MAIPTTTFSPLSFTSNPLIDLIKIVNDKNILVLYTSKAYRVFHSISFDQQESENFLKNIRVIYVDCNSHQDVLDEGGWEYYLKYGVKDCHELEICSLLRKTIIEKSTVPHKTYLRFSF